MNTDGNQNLRDRLSGDMGETPMPRGTGVSPVGFSAHAKPISAP
jgi:hypothetical protein